MKNLPNRFFTSIDINNHPLINSKPVLKSRYFSLLKHFATNVYNNDLTAETLDIYRKILNVQSDTYQFKSNLMSYFLAPWRKKQILILINDLYLVNAPFNVSQNDFRETFTSFARGLCTNRQYKVLCKFIESAFNLPINDKLCDYGNTLSIQVEKNRKFLGKEKTRIVFTANMSSGKSTIINAIIGKKVTRTAQEVCTGNVSYIFNKSYEDGRVHLANDKITINAESDELLANDWEELCNVVTKGTTPTTLGRAFTTNGINFIKAESILTNHSFDRAKFAYIDNETNEILKRSIIKCGDIVFTIAGTLGRFALVDKTIIPANTNQAVSIIRANSKIVSPEYLYSFFIGDWHNEYYKKRVQQAVQANLSLSTIKSLPIAVLADNDMQKYNALITPIFKTMKANEYENYRLATLRDTLLPKLMNGEIDVSEVKI